MFPLRAREHRALLIAVALSSCTFDASIPKGVVVVCSADSECPGGLRCQRSNGQCVESPDDVAPSLVLSRLSLTPSFKNPLSQIDALSREAEARISFQTSEALAGTPRLRTTPRLTCTLLAASGDSFDFSCVVPFGDPPPADGPVALEADVVDAAGNTATLDLTTLGLKVDLTPPAAPDTVTAGRVVYRRVPWGMEETQGAPEFSVAGLPGAAPDAHTVLVTTARGERGRGKVQANGSFTSIGLDPVDSAAVDLVAVDGAGNVSAPTRVRDVEWVVTLGGKVAYDLSSSPHVMQAVGVQGARSLRPDALELGAADGVARVGGARRHVPGAASWQEHTSVWPTRSEPAVAWDPDRARLVRFGGVGVVQLVGLAPSNEVYEWTGADWFQMRPQGGDGTPSPRRNATLVYDPVFRRTVLFGGYDVSALGDAWAWDGRSWRRLSGGPPPRGEATAFFDVPRRQLIVVGGRGADGGLLGDAWALSAQSWRELDAGALGPRAGAAAAYDSSTGTALLFGGETPSGLAADTWRWTGEGFVPVPTDGGPSPRHLASLAVDPLLGEAHLVGGRSQDGGALSDTWAFTAGSWAPRPPVPAAAGGLDGGLLDAPPSLVWDTAAARTTVLAAGGIYQFDGSTWARRAAPRTTLAASGRLPLAWHPGEKAVIALHGRPNLDAYRLSPDGWVPWGFSLSGYRWTAAQDMAWEPATGQLFVQNNQSSYRFATPGWYPVVPSPTGLPAFVGLDFPPFPFLLFSPSATSAVSIATALEMPDRGPALFVGPEGRLRVLTSPGVVSDQSGNVSPVAQGRTTIWVQDGGAWTPEPIDRDVNLVMPTALSLPDGGAIIAGALFVDGGGISNARGVAFAVSGSTTTPLPDTPVGGLVSLSWSAARERVLAYSGFDPLLNAPSAVFELDGSAWAEVPVFDPEGDGNVSSRLGSSLVHDEVRGVDVAVGGVTFVASTVPGTPPVVTRYRDTWFFHHARARPATLMRVALGAAGLQEGFEPARATLQVYASGTGQALDGGALDGYEVDVWRHGGWRPLATVAHQPGQVQPATVVLTDRGDLESLVRGPPELLFAVSPRGVNGSGRAAIDLDYVVLRLEYRLP